MPEGFAVCQALLDGGIWFLLVCPAQEVIDADTIESCQAVQDRNGNVQPSQFVIGICGLVNLKENSQVLLL